MWIEGLPQKFWIVTNPSPVSTLEDICFESDFAHFAGQVRGGLHEQQIKGIFADLPAAKAHAEELLERAKEQTTARYQYYVATFSRCVVVPASNAREALEAGERHPLLAGGTVLTVRVATGDEIGLHGFHDPKIAGETN